MGSESMRQFVYSYENSYIITLVPRKLLEKLLNHNLTEKDLTRLIDPPQTSSQVHFNVVHTILKCL